MTLVQILEEMQTQNGFMNADTTPQPVNGRVPGSEVARCDALSIAKRQASERIAELRQAYYYKIYESSVVIFASGGTPEARQEFRTLAEADEALVVEGDGLYKLIAAQAEFQMSGKRIANTAFISELVEHVAAAIGKFARPYFTQYPKMPMQYVDAILATNSEVVRLVKEIATPCTTVPLCVAWLQQNVASLAFAQKFSSDPLAVVVLIEDPQDVTSWQNAFMPGCPWVAVNLSGKVTPAKALDAAKNGLQKLMTTGS